ncbi:MAG: hypothetical protein KKC99_03645, partial [Proteobacteria bacterium]|nr:hypothetical protein [Pseudomonadota bacterium]
FSIIRFHGDKDKAASVYEGTEPLVADDIADIIYWTTTLPAHININNLEVMPVDQSFAGFAIHRTRTN